MWDIRDRWTYERLWLYSVTAKELYKHDEERIERETKQDKGGAKKPLFSLRGVD